MSVRGLLFVVLLCTLGLGGCQWLQPAPPPAPVAPPPPPPPPRPVVAELRAEASRVASMVEIVPVENPAITVLLSGARVDFGSGDIPAAEAQVQTALEIEPENPRVLQEMAELHLHQQRYAQAAELARRAYERSAQLGELCARSWLTLAEVAVAAGRDAALEKQKAHECVVQPLPRM